MALAPTTNSGIAGLMQNVGQGSQKLSSNNTNLQAAGITTDAQAQALNQAYNTLVGIGSNDGTLQQAAGAAVFQPLNGYTVGSTNQGSGLSTVALSGQPLPTGFNLSPDQLSSAAFNSWSTGYQRQYIDNWITNNNSSFATSAILGGDYKRVGGYIQIGANAPPDTSQTPPVAAPPPINVVITPSQDSAGKPIYSGGSIYIIENLTKTSFAPMTASTQDLIAKYDGVMSAVTGRTIQAFATIAAAINVNKVNNVIVDPRTARTQQINQINIAINQIVKDARNSGIQININADTSASNNALVVPGAFANADTGSTQNGFLVGSISNAGGNPSINPKNDGRLLCYNDVAVYVNELLTLQNKLLNMSVFSADSILPQINAITTRYTNLSAFGNIPNQFSAADTNAAATASGAGKTNSSGGTAGVAPLRVNVVSTDNPDLSASLGPKYYVYQVESWHGRDAQSDSNYNAVIQNNVQRYMESGFDNNPPDYTTDQNQSTEIHAGDWVLVDAAGNLVNISQTTLTPLKLKGDGSNSPYIYYQASAGGSLDKSGLPAEQINGGTTAYAIQTYQSTVTAGTTNQTTIGNGYQKLIQAERQIQALQGQMDLVVSNDPNNRGRINAGKALDMPNLIFLLQLYTNLIDEQQNAAATELVNQQNDLLNTYSQMQAMVNAVQGKFKPGDQTQQLDIFGNLQTSNTNGTTFYTDFTADTLLNGIPQGNGQPKTSVIAVNQGQLDILSMFDKNLGKTANPIETINGIQRTTNGLYDIFDSANGKSFKTIAHTSTAWNSYGTTLSSLVTQVNQQTQLQMNNIDTLNKEKDQHFNLANNCLSKLNDLLSAIGRNLN